MNTEERVGKDYIERALEKADLDAIRMALYQQTADHELVGLPVAAKMDASQRAMLIDKAASWLESNYGPRELVEPSEAKLRHLINVATNEEVCDLDFEARKELPAFRRYPMMIESWPGERARIPDGFKVAIVGGGFGGITAAVQLKLLGIPYVVFERQAEPGGVWTMHRYPDIRVDSASINYSFAFVKNPQWSEHYARGHEVQKHVYDAAKEQGVHENTLYGHSVEKAVFDQDRNIWVLEVMTPAGPKTFEANVIFSCSGLFSSIKEIAFKNQEAFQGEIVHPSRWPTDFDPKGKRIAIIGNGSTGVQLLSPISKSAEKIYVFQRTPQWISPRKGYGEPVEPEVQWLIKNFPGYWNWSRYMVFAALFDTHEFFFTDPDWIAQGGQVNKVSDEHRQMLISYIKAQTGGRVDLIEKVTPNVPPLSRRPVVDNGWYRALTRDNVELVVDNIEGLTETGIETEDGRVHEVDVIITATGFDLTKYLLPARYEGLGGVEIQEYWASCGSPRAYIGMMVPKFPNLFLIYGPNSQPISGGTSTPLWLALWISFGAQCIMRMLQDGKSRVEVTEEAFDRYNDAHDEESRKLHILHSDSDPHKNYWIDHKNRRLQTSAPWSGPDYHRLCTEVEWGDLEFC